MGDVNGHAGLSNLLFRLEDLGIRRTKDQFGNNSLAIDLDVDARFGITTCQAVYDERQRKWQLVTSMDLITAGVKPLWKNPSPSPRASPAPNGPTRYAERLSQQLADSEKQIRDFAEYGPVGMVTIAAWANSQFYDISGRPPADDEYYDHSFVAGQA